MNNIRTTNKEESESQEHVLKCKEIVKETNILVNGDIEYNHIFDKEVEKQANVTILFEKLWKIINKIIKENDIQNYLTVISENIFKIPRC